MVWQPISCIKGYGAVDITGLILDVMISAAPGQDRADEVARKRFNRGNGRLPGEE
jgi:hypothetical protein